MAEPFLSEIRMMTFNFPPKGWAFCNGQVLPINQNQALFALLGTTYGGNGQTTFALPNLQGQAPIHTSAAALRSGRLGGEQAHTLTSAKCRRNRTRPCGPRPTATSNGAHQRGRIHRAQRLRQRPRTSPRWSPAPLASSAQSSHTPISSLTWCSTSASPCRAFSPRRILKEANHAAPMLVRFVCLAATSRRRVGCSATARRWRFRRTKPCFS